MTFLEEVSDNYQRELDAGFANEVTSSEPTITSTPALAVLPVNQPNKRVILKLEELLAMAKTGEIRAFVCAMALVGNDGRGTATGVSRAGRADLAPLVVALERSKLRLLGFVEDYDIDLELAGTNF